MGSWNATCGISNLHIKVNQEMYVFLLTPRIKYNNNKKINVVNFCYTDTYFSPLLFPFKSYYNGYGNGENSEKYTFDIVEKFAFDELNIKFQKEISFWNLIDSHEIYICYIHGDVVKHILNNHIIYIYKTLHDSKINTLELVDHKYNDFVGMIPSLVDDLLKIDITDISKSKNPIRKFILCFNFIDNYLVENVISHFNEDDTFKLLIPVLYDDVVNRNKKNIFMFFKNLFLGYIINDFMRSTRKAWIVPIGAGSQQQDTIQYRVLNDAINKIIDNEEIEG